MREKPAAEKILLESLKNKSPVFAWYIFNDHVIKAQLQAKAVRLQRGQLIFQVLPESLAYAEQMISGIGKINFMIPDHSFLFSCELKNMDKEGQLQVGMPEKCMFFERRQAGERISPDIPIMVKFKSSTSQRAQLCNDISPGGLSVVFSKSYKSKLKEEGAILDLELTCAGKSIILKAKVAKILALTPFMLDNHPYAGERVSFQFVDISDENRLYISKIIEGHKKFLDDLLGR